MSTVHSAGEAEDDPGDISSSTEKSHPSQHAAAASPNADDASSSSSSVAADENHVSESDHSSKETSAPSSCTPDAIPAVPLNSPLTTQKEGHSPSILTCATPSSDSPPRAIHENQQEQNSSGETSLGRHSRSNASSPPLLNSSTTAHQSTPEENPSTDLSSTMMGQNNNESNAAGEAGGAARKHESTPPSPKGKPAHTHPPHTEEPSHQSIQPGNSATNPAVSSSEPSPVKALVPHSNNHFTPGTISAFGMQHRVCQWDIFPQRSQHKATSGDASSEKHSRKRKRSQGQTESSTETSTPCAKYILLPEFCTPSKQDGPVFSQQELSNLDSAYKSLGPQWNHILQRYSFSPSKKTSHLRQMWISKFGPESLRLPTAALNWSVQDLQHFIGAVNEKLACCEKEEDLHLYWDALQREFTSSNTNISFTAQVLESQWEFIKMTGQVRKELPEESTAAQHHHDSAPVRTTTKSTTKKRPQKRRRKVNKKLIEAKECAICGVDHTPLWRYADNKKLCNKCGIYYQRNGTHRPNDLKQRAKGSSGSNKSSSSGSKRKRSKSKSLTNSPKTTPLHSENSRDSSVSLGGETQRMGANTPGRTPPRFSGDGHPGVHHPHFIASSAPVSSSFIDGRHGYRPSNFYIPLQSQDNAVYNAQISAHSPQGHYQHRYYPQTAGFPGSPGSVSHYSSYAAPSPDVHYYHVPQQHVGTVRYSSQSASPYAANRGFPVSDAHHYSSSRLPSFAELSARVRDTSPESSSEKPRLRESYHSHDAPNSSHISPGAASYQRPPAIGEQQSHQYPASYHQEASH